jgi:hypothetical protein
MALGFDNTGHEFVFEEDRAEIPVVSWAAVVFKSLQQWYPERRSL